jgi:flagellar hook protein FlgE
MNVSPNISSIQNSLQVMSRDTENMQGTQNREASLAKSATNQITETGIAQANSQTIKAQDQMLGALLDIRA